MKQHELELLADYVGGAIDGTPEAAEVTRKIRDNAAWAEAHSQLVVALGRVEEQLRETAHTTETMPDDVWARLETALGDPALIGVGAEPPIWVPPAPHQPPAPPRRASRRWRWLAPIGVAAAVLGCFGLGSQMLRPQSTATDSADTTAGKGVNPESAYSLPPSLLQLSSGRDYAPSTLAVLTDDQALAFTTKEAGPPTALTRLSSPAALAGCLEAIDQIAPGAATVVDFASYQGNPALIVVVAKATGGKWVGVAGPDCSPGQPDLKDQRVFE